MLSDAVNAIIASVAHPLDVTREIGPAGNESSASAPLIVWLEGRGRDEFVIKCPALSHEEHPYLCANEWIAGLLAVQCGLPCLEMIVVQHRRCLAVGWRRLQQAMWATLASHERVLDAADNADMLYCLVVFDALIRNIDRLPHNVTARRMTSGTASYQLFVYDHDRALLPPSTTPATLSEAHHLDDARLWIRVGAIRARITDAERLRSAVDEVQNYCSVIDIRAIVESTPTEWLSRDDQALVIAFLVDRVTRLDEIVAEKAKVVLPGLR